MSDLTKIEATLVRTAKRRRLDRGLRGLWMGLLWGGAIWLAVIAIYKLAPIPPQSVIYAGLAALFIPFVGFCWGYSRPLTLDQIARWVDGKRALRERISTALELARSPERGPWTELVIADAAKAVETLNPKELLPFALPRSMRWSVLILLLCVGLGFVPEYRTAAFVQKKKDEQVIKETGRALAELTQRTLQNRPPALETTKKSLEQVNELADQMGKASLTRNEALKDLANAAEKLKEQTRELTKNSPGLKNLEKAARSSSKGSSSAEDLQKQIDNLSKQMGANSANPDAMDKFKDKLDKAKEAAANLPKENSPESKAAREKLEAQIADLAKQAKELGLDLPSLSEAMAALSEAQPDQVLKDLEVAEVELEKLQAMAKALEKMQIQAQKLGKDLAEQLKNGQAEAAQATLQKMAEQLSKSGLGNEQMQKLSEEVSKALQPASQYGKVGDYLKQAANQMQSGEKGEAGESLKQAANELGKMMQQLGDAQSLLSTLESLQQAQMAIANGQSWESSSARGAPRFGKKEGEPGRGVGTWTDEDSWAYPEFSERWDNSGIERPDQEGKGISDRGDGQLADNLAPTKVKGQITPGGPMPSITLKGVSIKGTSKVQFQEMVTAAQSDAQGALNQDQVPKAYQGAVRNYFDDLKE